MKNSFFSFLFFGFFLAALISFAEPQGNNRKTNNKSNSSMRSDTAASRRIEHNTHQPALQKTDSLPMPKPTPRVPLPDTMSKGMMK